MKNIFTKTKEAKSDPNPFLDIKHPHNWLLANLGKELVCGDCGLRKKA